MPNDDHIAQLTNVFDWSDWRQRNPGIVPDLRDANLAGANLSELDFSHTDLRGANLTKANLTKAKLTKAKLNWAKFDDANLMDANLAEAVLRYAELNRANLSHANLSEADLSGAILCLAYLGWANLSAADLTDADLNRVHLQEAKLGEAKLIRADLSGAILSNTDLREAHLCKAHGASLIGTDFTGADLTGCYVYGVSAWGLKLDRAKQQNLVITGPNEPTVTVDNIEVAQFIYLLLHNQKIRDVIDTITSKAVLILGRFTDERKAVLDALREELRKRDYLPMLFDFDKPTSQTTDETITLLARMSRFVIVDISDAKSVLQELRAIVPDLPSVPVQPVIIATQEEPGMFDFYRNFRSFLNVHRYASQDMKAQGDGLKAWIEKNAPEAREILVEGVEMK
jgi:uncharacterized protein YjbI with pentapeptide repeats